MDLELQKIDSNSRFAHWNGHVHLRPYASRYIVCHRFSTIISNTQKFIPNKLSYVWWCMIDLLFVYIYILTLLINEVDYIQAWILQIITLSFVCVRFETLSLGYLWKWQILESTLIRISSNWCICCAHLLRKPSALFLFDCFTWGSLKPIEVENEAKRERDIQRQRASESQTQIQSDVRQTQSSLLVSCNIRHGSMSHSILKVSLATESSISWWISSSPRLVQSLNKSATTRAKHQQLRHAKPHTRQVL